MKNPTVAMTACTAPVMKFAPSTERATVRNSRISSRTRSAAAASPRRASRPARGRRAAGRSSAISIIASLKPKRASTASAPDSAPSAQRPPAANCVCAAVDLGGQLLLQLVQPALDRIGRLGDQAVDALRRRSSCARVLIASMASRMAIDREHRERNQDRTTVAAVNRPGDQRAPAAEPPDDRLVERRQHARQHRRDQQRPPQRPDDGGDEQRRRAHHHRLRPAPRGSARHARELIIGGPVELATRGSRTRHRK